MNANGIWRLVFVPICALAIVSCGSERYAPVEHPDASQSDGLQGDSGASADAAPMPTPSVDGVWLMLGFEDPVGVELARNGGVLQGYGSISGRPSLADDFANPLDGTIVGNRLRFGFLPPFAGDRYETDVIISSDGKRMAGTFERASLGASGYPVVWLPLPQGEKFLERKSFPALEMLLKGGARKLVLRYVVEERLDFLPGISGAFGATNSGALYSTFGTFGASEGKETQRSVETGDGVQVLAGVQYGEVEATWPTLATRIFVVTQLAPRILVEVMMPSGGVYVFDSQ